MYGNNPFTNNFTFLIITTNKPNMVKIDVSSSDRRYIVYKATDKYLNRKYNSNFWQHLVKFFKSPIFISALYDYLNEMDLTTTDFRTERLECLTKSYKQLCSSFIAPEVLFLEEFCYSFEHKDLINIKSSTLYENFKVFCEENNLYRQYSTISNRNFTFKILEFPCITKNRHSGGIYFTFNPQEVLKYFISKRWTENNDKNEPQTEDRAFSNNYINQLSDILADC